MYNLLDKLVIKMNELFKYLIVGLAIIIPLIMLYQNNKNLTKGNTGNIEGFRNTVGIEGFRNTGGIEGFRNTGECSKCGANEFFQCNCRNNQAGCVNNAAVAKSSLYTSDLPRSLYTSYGSYGDKNFSSRKNPAYYKPPCLTNKPYGNPQASYYYWKYLPNMLESQYVDCNKYGCSNLELNGYTALPTLEETIGEGQSKVDPDGTFACSVHPDYFNSPERFCKEHPEHYPCPNWWMKNPVQFPIDNTANFNVPCIKREMPVKPQVPYTPNDHGFCVPEQDPTCALNDGKAAVMIRAGREDIALC